MSQDEPNSDDDGDTVYPGRACLGPFRLDEDEVECSTKCPQNDGGVYIVSRDDCKRRKILEEHGIRLS